MATKKKDGGDPKPVFCFEGEKPGHLAGWPIMMPGTPFGCGFVFEITMDKQELRFRITMQDVDQVAKQLAEIVRDHVLNCG